MSARSVGFFLIWQFSEQGADGPGPEEEDDPPVFLPILQVP